MKSVGTWCVVAALAGSVSTIASAQAQAPKSMDMPSMGKMEGTDAKKAGASHSATGVIKSVDPAKGAVTLAHDPVKSLNWPAMTMAFKVQDRQMLDKVKAGDKVAFKFVQSGKDYVITEIK